MRTEGDRRQLRTTNAAFRTGNRPRGVLEIARDPAKVEDQVRFLARAFEECGVRNAEGNVILSTAKGLGAAER